MLTKERERGEREKVKREKVVVLCCWFEGKGIGLLQKRRGRGRRNHRLPPKEIIGAMGTRSKKGSDGAIVSYPEGNVRTFDKKRTVFFSVVFFFFVEGRRGQIEVSFSISFSLSFF